MRDIKFAVIVSTYRRKNGESERYLRRMFNQLLCQTYDNFKLFLIGDDYSPEQEFYSICGEFPQNKIYYENIKDISYRSGIFNIANNKWANGGLIAKYIGIKKAIKQGFKYYLHLDDDDIWYSNHILTHYKTILNYPQVDFIYTISKIRDSYLPKYEIDTQVYYNNKEPTSCALVHSTWCINLHSIGSKLLNIFKERIKIIEEMRLGVIQEYALQPMDATTVKLINSNKEWNVIFVPKLTCFKETDQNIPN